MNGWLIVEVAFFGLLSLAALVIVLAALKNIPRPKKAKYRKSKSGG